MVALHVQEYVAILKQAAEIFAPVINSRSLHRAVERLARRNETGRQETARLASCLKLARKIDGR
jgi:hypothetical protein